MLERVSRCARGHPPHRVDGGTVILSPRPNISNLSILMKVVLIYSDGTTITSSSSSRFSLFLTDTILSAWVCLALEVSLPQQVLIVNIAKHVVVVVGGVCVCVCLHGSMLPQPNSDYLRPHSSFLSPPLEVFNFLWQLLPSVLVQSSGILTTLVTSMDYVWFPSPWLPKLRTISLSACLPLLFANCVSTLASMLSVCECVPLPLLQQLSRCCCQRNIVLDVAGVSAKWHKHTEGERDKETADTTVLCCARCCSWMCSPTRLQAD